MRKNSFLVILAVLIIFGYSCHEVDKSWTMKANAEGVDAKQAYLYRVNIDRSSLLMDSANISDHKFSFSGINNSDSMGVYVIKFSKGHQSVLTFFVKNSDEISVDILGEYKNVFSGNELQIDYSRYMQAKQKELDLMREMMGRIIPDASEEQLENNSKWYLQNTKMIDQEKADIISNIKDAELNGYLALDEVRTSSISDKLKFESFASSLTTKGKETKYGKTLLEILQYFEAYDLLYQSVVANYEEIHQGYGELDDSNKNSKFGIEISNKLAVLEALDYGKKPPPIIAKTLSGESFDLTQVKSKIVLIDFWASWCGPCREENKNYVNLYSQFKTKGFEIVGYSLDTDMEKWNKAVKHDGLLWINVSNLREQQDDSIIKSYQIDAVPSNLIIKEGKIVARNIFGYELEDFLNINLSSQSN